MRVTEGGVTVEAPEQPDAGAGEGVFFNPEQELNRDLTVATLRALREREDRLSTYLDAHAATGIRGVRAAADGWETTCVDTDPDAVALCEENLARNDCTAAVRQADANVVCHEDAFDVVDLDPFGSPVPFADAAVQGARHVLCATATDLAPLCGAHFNSGVRTYGCVPQNTEYHTEMGLRVAIGALVRTAARYDVAARPVLSHATRHYVRTYLTFDYGAQVADDAIADCGFVYHCRQCLWRDHERALTADPPEACPNCGTDPIVAGPIWLARTAEPDVCGRVAGHLDEDMGTQERAADLLETLAGELDRPTHYDQHRCCEEWGRPASAMDDFLAALADAGHEATRTHYGGTTFKTDAAIHEIRAATEHLAPED